MDQKDRKLKKVDYFSVKSTRIFMPKSPVLLVVLFSILLIISSCSPSEASSDEKTSSEIETDQVSSEEGLVKSKKKSIAEPIVIGAFSEFPEGIDGCSCYFSQHSSALESGSYIFVTNFEELGFMMLNDKMVKFKLDETVELKDGKLMERWSNANFTLIKKTAATGQLDETWQHSGTISIKPKDGSTIESTIIGECGC